LRDMPWL